MKSNNNNNNNDNDIFFTIVLFVSIFYFTEVIRAARGGGGANATDLGQLLESVNEKDIRSTCFTEALLAAVSQGNVTSVNHIICFVANKMQKQTHTKDGHNLDFEECVKKALEKEFTELAVILSLCLLARGGLLRCIRYFLGYHDNNDCLDLVSRLFARGITEEFR